MKKAQAQKLTFAPPTAAKAAPAGAKTRAAAMRLDEEEEVQLKTMVPKKLKVELKALAAQLDVTMESLMVEALQELVEKKRKELEKKG